MKRILVRSVYDAFSYVMDHFYPNGLDEYAVRKDSYAVISIQDTHTGGFGFKFSENMFCKGALTLYFDDIETDADGGVLFTADQADEIITFIDRCRSADTLLIHCYGGESRSRAVGAFASEMLGGSSRRYFETGNPNMHVYNTLKAVYAHCGEP